MKKTLAAVLTAALSAFALGGFATPARAQNLDEVFRKASPVVVVMRSKGRDVRASGITHFNETGSGVLISQDGRVMTAAHVVNGMDEITVEGIGGEIVGAKLLSANAAADVALMQLERVTKAMRVARLGNSDSVRVGEQVMVVGAPYGLAYSMSVGWISARWGAQHDLPRHAPGGVLSDHGHDQHGELRWPLVQHAGRGHRYRQPEHLKIWRERGPGLRRDDQERTKAPGPAEGVLGRSARHDAHRPPRDDLQRSGARRVPRQV